MKRAMLLLALLAGILWGSAGVFVRMMTAGGLDNVTIVFVRVAFGTLIMLPVLALYDRKLLRIKLRDLWLFVLSGVVAMVGLNVCYNYTINTLSISLAAVLLSLAPIFVLILSAVFFKERITGRKVLCMALAILGCLLVSGFLENIGGTTWSAAGIAVGFLSALFYASYTIFSKLAMQRGYHALTITFYSMVTAAVVLAFFADYGAIGAFVASDAAAGIGLLVGNALCVAVLPYVLYTVSLGHADAGKAAILAAAGEPSAAMVFGALFFAEVPSWLMVVGLAVVVVAISVICLPDKTRAPTPDDAAI